MPGTVRRRKPAGRLSERPVSFHLHDQLMGLAGQRRRELPADREATVRAGTGRRAPTRPAGQNGRVRLEAITWKRLTDKLADELAGMTAQDGSPWLRVGIDAAPAARPGELAGRLAEELRLRGRFVQKNGAFGFLRPASLRLEFGRHDPDAYYSEWFDRQALWREVFNPLEPGGSGRVLPDLWDPQRDRATRSPYVQLPTGGVLLLHGPLLLGQWFPFDLTVHLSLSQAALGRRTAEGERWTVPAFARYEEEVAPRDAADVVVHADDPRHPAWNGIGRTGGAD